MLKEKEIHVLLYNYISVFYIFLLLVFAIIIEYNGPDFHLRVVNIGILSFIEAEALELYFSQ
jgi:hypothetical protein|tara:strand:- start:253 stop:438 length:186 start_codon:yes stop_codon:yes gene_type:complete